MEWDVAIGVVQDPLYLYSKEGAKQLETQNQWLHMNFELLSTVPTNLLRLAIPAEPNPAEPKLELASGVPAIGEELAQRIIESLEDLTNSQEDSLERRFERAISVAHNAEHAWQSTTAENLLRRMQERARSAPATEGGIVHLAIATDGSLLFEWQNETRRFSFNLEAEKDRSFWYFLDTIAEKTVRQRGSLDNIDVSEVTRRMLGDG
jgi:hypothetical protein